MPPTVWSQSTLLTPASGPTTVTFPSFQWNLYVGHYIQLKWLCGAECQYFLLKQCWSETHMTPMGHSSLVWKTRVSKDLKRCDRQCRLANSPCPLPWPVLTNASGKASYSFPWLRSTDTAPGHSHGKKLWAKRWKSKTVKMTSKKLFAALIKCLFSLASCLEWRCDARSSGSLLVIMRAK